MNRIRVSRETFAKGVIDENSVQLGKLMGTGSNDVPFGAPLKGFTRHALVVGMPGTGKTTFSVNLLLQFYKRGIPFLAIEPTKSEYRAMIDAVPDLQVFTPGKNSVVPFIINPFLPPDGITLEKGNMESAGVFRLLNLVIQNGNAGYTTRHFGVISNETALDRIRVIS